MADNPLPKSGIYCIRNIVSGRVYVGSAVKLKSRWNAHRHLLRRGKHHSRILQRSWNKHGTSAFAFELLESVADVTALIEREQYWIDQLNAFDPVRGFNAYPTAGSPLGVKASDETRAKQSAMRKGKKRPPFSLEHRLRISEARKQTKASAETRAKMSISRKGKKRPPRSEEHCAKISAGKIGYKRTMESRMNQSAATKGRPIAIEHLAKHRRNLVARNKRRSTGDLANQLRLPI